MKSFKDFIINEQAYKNKNAYKQLKIKKYKNNYLVYSNFCKAICKDKKEIIDTFLSYSTDENKEEIEKLVDNLMANL